MSSGGVLHSLSSHPLSGPPLEVSAPALIGGAARALLRKRAIWPVQVVRARRGCTTLRARCDSHRADGVTTQNGDCDMPTTRRRRSRWHQRPRQGGGVSTREARLYYRYTNASRAPDLHKVLTFVVDHRGVMAPRALPLYAHRSVCCTRRLMAR